MKTAPTIDIQASLAVVVLRIVAGLAATVTFVAVACHVVPPMDDALDLMIGGVGSAASVLWTCLGLWRLATLRGPIVTIAPQGIRDRRILGDMVPWSAVARVSTQEDTRANKVMVLSLEPRAERALAKDRKRRRDGLRVGAEGLCVTALGLRTSHETLLATTLAYLEAWRAARP